MRLGWTLTTSLAGWMALGAWVSSCGGDSGGPGTGGDGDSDADSDADADVDCGVHEVSCPDGSCADLSSDPAHCGDCRNDCGPGATCTSGQCGCSGAGEILCDEGGGCADLSSDVHNCGRCGNDCGPAGTCTAGGCSCDPAFVECPNGGGCADLASDPANCGGCGDDCGPAAGCTAGDCTCSGVGLVLCPDGGGCADLSSDPNHCGDCRGHCPDGGACQSGQCVCNGGPCSCEGGLTDCNDGALVDCRDLRNDPANCGDCGRSCGGNQLCVDRNCEDGFPAPGGNCDACGDLRCCQVGGQPLCLDIGECP